MVDRSSDERSRRTWLVEVTERYRGDTPDVIAVELDVETGACNDAVRTLPPVLLLGNPLEPGRYRHVACTNVVVADLRAAFDEVPAPTGNGPPAAVAPVDTNGFDLAVLDDRGEVLRYLPGDGETVGLAECPGATHFAQVRRTAASRFEVVRWRYADWTAVEVIDVADEEDSGLEWFPQLLACGEPEARDVWLPLGPSGRLIGPGQPERAVNGVIELPGGGAALAVDGDGPSVASPWPDGDVEWTTVDLPIDGDRTDVLAVTVRPDGWRLEAVGWHNGPDRQYVVADVAPDGTVTVVAHRWLRDPGLGVVLLVDPAAGLVAEPGPAPPPFARSGIRIDVPAPTLPTATTEPDIGATAEQPAPVDEAAREPVGEGDVAPIDPAGGSTVAGATAEGSGNLADRSPGSSDSTTSRWVLAALLGAIIAAGVAVAVRARRDGTLRTG